MMCAVHLQRGLSHERGLNWGGGGGGGIGGGHDMLHVECTCCRLATQVRSLIACSQCAVANIQKLVCWAPKPNA